MDISVVLPIYNEEYLLPSIGRAILRDMQGMDRPTEIIAVDNGSCDRTAEHLHDLMREGGGAIREVRLHDRDYGAALKKGILEARGRVRAMVDLDMWRKEFLRKALAHIDAGAAIVVGCKDPAFDRRPGLRRLATAVHARLLREAFPELKGLDCHGSLVLDWRRCDAVFAGCRLDGDTFKPEFLIRAVRSGLPIALEPVSVEELRPARTSLAVRVFAYLPKLWRLRRLFAEEASRSSSRPRQGCAG
ncbi:MAG: glycosyltransferase [Elusimicrobiota bacterium]|jgi:glycosyltransferase involved in cell wall biosynthesis